jgi:hypothetical protein
MSRNPFRSDRDAEMPSRTPSPRYGSDVEMRSRSPSPEGGLPWVNAGRTLSGVGTPAGQLRHSIGLEHQPFGGINDCGLRAMASVMGTTPRDLLTRANRNDGSAADAEWRHIEQHQMNRDHYVDLAARAHAPVSYENTSDFRRLPPRGQAAVVVSGNHAVAMARSDSGHHGAWVDPQARQHHWFDVRRVPDAQADRVEQLVFMHGPARPRGPWPER